MIAFPSKIESKMIYERLRQIKNIKDLNCGLSILELYLEV
eukprot:UN02029